MSGADDFIHEPCPQCGEYGRPSRLDQHIAKAHADLPPCTASITNEHTDGTIRCAFRVGHRDDYGVHHAGPRDPRTGRFRWSDGAEGAVPHQSDPARAEVERDEEHPEPPSDEELNPALPVRPDPRQAAYDAVYEYIRRLGDYLPPDPVHRNAIIWRAIHAALNATPVGRCVSSHCVEGDHLVFVEEAQ